MRLSNHSRDRRPRSRVRATAAVGVTLFGALFGALGAALVAAGPLGAALPGSDEIAFKVLRGGEPLGHHRVAFRREAGDLHVEIDIDLEVKLAFVTVFRYRHTNHEVWRDGRLVSIETETNDDGETYWMRGRASDAGLAVEGSSGSFVAPADVMPTSYWNAQTVTKSRLLDTQRGRLVDVEIIPAGSETISVAGEPVEARRYAVSGDLELDLWYAADGEWAKIAFEARGAEVVYRRLGAPAPSPGVEEAARAG
jgi:hypothetical protein